MSLGHEVKGTGMITRDLHLYCISSTTVIRYGHDHRLE
jgi:hypothetical protein